MTSVPIRMLVRWKVPPEEARTISATLQSLMIQTRNKPGCAECRVSIQVAPDARVDYREEWRTESDLQRQIRSDRFSSLAELIERATGQPLVEFTFPDGTTRGLDYAEEVRQSPDFA